MGAILLGSANGTPPDQGVGESIPIPEQLPVDPTILVDVQGPAPAPTQVSDGGSVPPGGADNQVLTKQSSDDYDSAWEELPDGTHDHVPEDTTINRTGGFISSVVKDSKTVTITRDVNDQIQFVNDGTYQKEIIRTGGVITSIDVTVL